MSQLEPFALPLPETLLTALRLRAARQGVAPVELGQVLLQQALTAELRELAGAPPLAAVIGHLVAAGNHKKLRRTPVPEARPSPAGG
jgi:plasmid stability protein